MTGLDRAPNKASVPSGLLRASCATKPSRPHDAYTRSVEQAGRGPPGCLLTARRA
jgi:hypothetical protein